MQGKRQLAYRIGIRLEEATLAMRAKGKEGRGRRRRTMGRTMKMRGRGRPMLHLAVVLRL